MKRQKGYQGVCIWNEKYRFHWLGKRPKQRKIFAPILCLRGPSHRDVTRKLSISIVGQSFRSRYLWGTTNKSFQPETPLPTGADEGVQGVRTPLRWPAANIILLIFSGWKKAKQSKAKQKQEKNNKQKQKTLKSFLVGVPLLRKILDPPLAYSDWQIYLPRLFTNNRTYLSSSIKYVKDNLFTIDVHTMLIPAFYWQNIKFLIFLLKTY